MYSFQKLKTDFFKASFQSQNVVSCLDIASGVSGYHPDNTDIVDLHILRM
jgi:hypothetical protein